MSIKNGLMKQIDIKRYRGCDNRLAKKTFDIAKKLDNDPYNLRPTEVPIEKVLEALGLDKEVHLPIIERMIKEKENEKKSPLD